MPTVPSNAMAFQKGTKIPGLGSLLISTGVIGDECSLCGNFFDTHNASTSALRLPCVDNQCQPCARMWNILSSPTCLVCYGDFKCPRFTRKEARKALPRLITDFGNRLQPPSPLDSHIHSFLSFRDRHAAFQNADTGSDGNINAYPGSLKREDEDVQPVPELGKDLLEALALANNRVGTDFNFQDIEAKIPWALLRDCTNFQLADRLTQACIMKASESGSDSVSSGRSSQQPNKDDLDRERGAIDKAKPYRCTHCRRTFRTHGHLRQHMIVHAPDKRTCSVCGKVMGNVNSRRTHERHHRETEGEREERLGKAKLKRQRVRESSSGRVQKS